MTVADRPSLEQHARELLDMPPEWRAYRFEAKGKGVLVEGAVVTEVYKRGPRAGTLNYGKRDKSTEAVIVILDAQHQQWLMDWEGATGKCHKCDGTSREWAGWTRSDGSIYRPCTRCDATGQAQLNRPITQRGGFCQ